MSFLPNLIFILGESRLPSSSLDPLMHEEKLVTTSFGSELENIMRYYGFTHAAKLLTCLSRSSGYMHYNPDIHEENGVFKEEGEELSEKESNNMEKLKDASIESSQLMTSSELNSKNKKKEKIDSLELKVVSGRHRLLALQRIMING